MAIAGKNAKVQVSTDNVTYTDVHGVKNYSWNERVDTVDTTNFYLSSASGGDYQGAKTRLRTTKDLPIEISGDFYVDGAGQDVIRAAMKSQDQIYVQVLHTGATGAKAAAYVTALKISGDVEGAVEFSASFASNGSY